MEYSALPFYKKKNSGLNIRHLIHLLYKKKSQSYLHIPGSRRFSNSESQLFLFLSKSFLSRLWLGTCFLIAPNFSHRMQRTLKSERKTEAAQGRSGDVLLS